MFWQSKQVSSPHLEALLNREDCTIYDLMDDEDILQECKSQNKKLLDFLTRPNVMYELITLMIQNPTTELEESNRYRYPHIACEILSCDIPTLDEKLAGLRRNISKRKTKQLDFWIHIWKKHKIKMWCKEGDVGLLQKLYSFIDTEEPLNSLLASFFSKVMSILVVRSKDQNWYSYQFKCLQVLTFLKSREKCIDLLLYHLETSAIMNLILKLVTEIEGSETRKDILNWLDSQQLVQRLVKLLAPNCQPSRHSNAAELLSDMIDGVRDIQKECTERSVEPDPILCTLESEETTTLLLDTILVQDSRESSIVGGIQVLLTLLKPKNIGSPNDQNCSVSNPEEATSNAVKIKISNATIPFFQRLYDVLITPPEMLPVKTTVEVIQVPYGNARLHVLKLFAALLSLDNPNIRAKLVELDIFKTILLHFFNYPWNNLMHAQVQYVLGEALNSVYPESDQEFYENIFDKCQLIHRILSAFTHYNVVKGGRVGYLGHLIEITKDIAAQCKHNNVLDTFLSTNLPTDIFSKWNDFVSQDLKYIKSMQKTLSTPRYMDEDYQNTFDFADAIFETKTSYEYRNNVFMQYEEPTLYNSNDQSALIMVNAEEQAKSEEMFNKLCECRETPNLDYDDDDNDETKDLQSHWMDRNNKSRIQTDWWGEDNTVKLERSSSSEEEDDNEKEEEISNSLDFWRTLSNTTSLQPVNPWGINAPVQSESDNWANFATMWPGESKATTNTETLEDKIDESDWACFTNFDSALTFTMQESEIDSTKEEFNFNVQIFSDVQEEENIFQTNLNEDSIEKEEPATTPNIDIVKTSDDDNANPIVIIENRIPEVQEEKSSDENVQSTVETVNSLGDSSPLEKAIETSAETVNEST